MKSIIALAFCIACATLAQSVYVGHNSLYPVQCRHPYVYGGLGNVASKYQHGHVAPYVRSDCGGCGTCSACKGVYEPSCGGCGSCSACKGLYQPSCGGCGSCSACRSRCGPSCGGCPSCRGLDYPVVYRNY